MTVPLLTPGRGATAIDSRLAKIGSTAPPAGEPSESIFLNVRPISTSSGEPIVVFFTHQLRVQLESATNHHNRFFPRSSTGLARLVRRVEEARR
jgi:hypothetical protein